MGSTCRNRERLTGLGYPASVYLFSLASKQAVRILRGVEQNHFPTQEYFRPTWSPDGVELAAVSTTSEDRWANSGSIGIYSLRTSQYRPVTSKDSLQLYRARLFWLDKSSLTSSRTRSVRAPSYFASPSTAR